MLPEDRRELETSVAGLQAAIAELRKNRSDELPNVEIYAKAVDWALRYDEFFDPKQIGVARDLIKRGREFAEALGNGKAPWNSQTGLVVRAYRSRIDGSVQPYGLVLPADWKPGDGKKRSLHFWCHGRGEKLSELAFIDDRLKNQGEFTPEGAIVCHLYGRFCCANKFAGEVDLFEALADIRKHYAVDSDRLVIRGFSMGGASTWQFSTHFAGMWAACAPGAGFAETAEFFNVFSPGKTPPPAWEQTLWRWYDATLYAANLANTKLVAYSGEIDKQKQAADIMTKFAQDEGIEFPHIIGPQTAHKYHPDAKPKIEAFITEALNAVRPAVARKVSFTTYTLIYPSMEWVEIERMGKQWEKARIDAELTDHGVQVTRIENVDAFRVRLPAAAFPGSATPAVSVEGSEIPFSKTSRDTWSTTVQRAESKWVANTDSDAKPSLSKRPGQCGPIDHALMQPFIFVEPTGQPLNAKVGKWAKGELDHAKKFWRQVFRGDAPTLEDGEVKADDIAQHNLILWGDPSSNSLLAKIIDRLPIKWTKERLVFNGETYDANTHAPVMIFPNPLNPERYVVINSSVTFREEALLNNSDQTPKLPDWAIVNLETPPGPKWPGKIVAAGFFDEDWKLLPDL